ncbi:MAG TPA: pyridoxal phosphate-dependent aminotransferase [Methylomirabilota bacterium]|jgi:aspartate/methionine/tyrosine aminotransferase|nr:pyridoxal phosphate-dependent aminotransferase [Methylomirabilota bacterium]
MATPRSPSFAELARRTEEITPFLAVEVFERAQELERQGHEVVHLEFGEPDFETPEPVRAAAIRALRDGRTKYTHSLGLPALREAIAERYLARYGVAVSPDQILVTAGTSPAMLLLFTGLLSPGDEVVLTDPHYACYPNFVRYADAVPVRVPAPEAAGWRAAPAAVAERLTPRTRAVLVNSPANPTGAVTPPGDLAALAELAERHDLWIVSDEIYHELSYGAPDHTILEFTDRAFVLNGFSKAYAMTGWRLGYLVAPKAHARRLQRLHQNFFISANEFVQWAGVAALREAGADVARFRAIFDERRRAMVAGLRGLGLGVGPEPAGAFYVFADAGRHCRSSYDFAFELLAGAHVAVTPGIDFGPGGEGYLRFSYANALPRIQDALARVGRFLAGREPSAGTAAAGPPGPCCGGAAPR